LPPLAAQADAPDDGASPPLPLPLPLLPPPLLLLLRRRRH
jgi:hypothetical protein